MTIDLTLTLREAEQIREALRYAAEEQERYCAWIEDRPMLPARQEAVDKITVEASELHALLLKVQRATYNG